MPGTISVSVVELSDLPSTSSNDGGGGDRFSLKVALGRREYLTDGKGDFSFPVSSLRDNLVIALLEADGNEVARAVIKTMQVMENRFWDAWFPLEGGGNAHMILQFSLSEDEQKRIYEKRESAVKRKYTDLITSGKRFSFSDEILKPLTPKSFTSGGPPESDEIHNSSTRKPFTSEESPDPSATKSIAGLKNDIELSTLVQQRTPEARTAEFVRPDTNELHEHSFYDSGKDESLTEPLSVNAHDLQESTGERVDPNITEGKIQDSRNLASIRNSPLLLSTKYGLDCNKQDGVETNSVNLVKKMINAFESSSSQENTSRTSTEPIKTSRSSKIESTGSVKDVELRKGHLVHQKSNYGQRSNTKVLKNIETLTKSLSSGMILEMNPEKSPKYLDSLPWKGLGDKSTSRNFINAESLGMIGLDTNGYASLLHIAHDDICTVNPEAAQTLKTTSSDKQEDTYKVSIDIESSSMDRVQTESVVGSFINESVQIGEVHRSSNDRIKSSIIVNYSHNNCQDKQVGLTETSAGDSFYGNEETFRISGYMEQTGDAGVETESSHASRTLKSMKSTTHQNFKEDYCSLGTFQESYSASHCETAMQILERSNNGYMEPSACGDSGEVLYTTGETCFVWYPSLWKRRLCFTTGTEQLIHVFEGCSIFQGTNMQKHLPDMDAEEEHKRPGDQVNEPLKDQDISSISDKSSEFIFPIPKMNRWWIEQGLRVIILVVACGTFISKTGAT